MYRFDVTNSKANDPFESSEDDDDDEHLPAQTFSERHSKRCKAHNAGGHGHGNKGCGCGGRDRGRGECPEPKIKQERWRSKLEENFQ